MSTIKDKLLRDRVEVLKRLQSNPDYIQLNYIDGLLSEYGSITDKQPNTDPDEENLDSFPKDALYLEQIWHLIKREQRFVHISELCDLTEPYWTDADEDTRKSRLSTNLSKAKREGLGSITNYKAGKAKTSYYWGSTRWLDENGKPKPEFAPKQNKNKTNKLNLE